MQPASLRQRVTFAARRVVAFVLLPVRRVMGFLFQIAERDRLVQLEHETRRLGSASVEAVTYLGSDLRQLDERLASLEEELAVIRRLLEEDPRAASASSSSAAASK